jgi:hypothetical protein
MRHQTAGLEGICVDAGSSKFALRGEFASHHRDDRRCPHESHQRREARSSLIDAAVPTGLDLHLICDNYATHKTPAVKKWLLADPDSVKA